MPEYYQTSSHREDLLGSMKGNVVKSQGNPVISDAGSYIESLQSVARKSRVGINTTLENDENFNNIAIPASGQPFGIICQCFEACFDV